MSVFHIQFSKDQTISNSYIGGYNEYIHSDFIPVIPGTNEKQFLLLTLTDKFFKSPVIKEDEVLSVFISKSENSINITRHLAVNGKDQINNLSAGYAKVFISKKVNSPQAQGSDSALPKFYLHTEQFTDAELAEETEVPGSGSEYTKLNGLPGWLQDNIFIDIKYQYWLQLNEYDVRKLDKTYDDIFRGGIGYLFLSRNIKKLNVTSTPQEAGFFFIQFT
jgi:uncharacterized membrane protein